MMETVLKLSRNGQLVLSSELRRLLDVQEGEYLHVRVIGHNLILTPQKVIDRDQAYFWSEEWQVAERAAQADIEAGRIETFDNVQELIRDLNS